MALDLKLVILSVAIIFLVFGTIILGEWHLAMSYHREPARCDILPLISTLGGGHTDILPLNQFKLNTTQTCYEPCQQCQTCNAPSIVAFQKQQALQRQQAEAWLDDPVVAARIEAKHMKTIERKKEEEEAAKKTAEHNLQLKIREETTAVCGKMYTLHNQWFILNHANQADPVNETVAMAHFKEQKYTREQLGRYDEVFSILRWWSHAYYHGMLETMPYINAMSYWYHEQPQPLKILHVLGTQPWVGLEWLGFNPRLASYPAKVFFAEKYHSIEMKTLPLPCIIQLRARYWRMFVQPYHYDPQKQHILICQRLGSREIANYEQFVGFVKQKFQNQLVARSYGDEHPAQLRELIALSKVIIYSHGANSANIHLFGHPTQQEKSLFHIGDEVDRLKPLIVIEITFLTKQGHVWRNVEWEMQQHGYKYFRITCDVQESINEYNRLYPGHKKNWEDENQFQQLSFILNHTHMEEIDKIIRDNI